MKGTPGISASIRVASGPTRGSWAVNGFATIGFSPTIVNRQADAATQESLRFEELVHLCEESIDDRFGVRLSFLFLGLAGQFLLTDSRFDSVESANHVERLRRGGTFDILGFAEIAS